MKHLKIVLIFSVLLVSCSKSELEQKLTADDSFWYIFQYDTLSNKYQNSSYGYKFYMHQKCLYVYYDYSTDKIREFDIDDVVYTKKWNYNKKNNKIQIQDFEYQIVGFNEDTLILKNKSDKIVSLINLYRKNPQIMQPTWRIGYEK
ncbi:MAG: hypothetical protein LBV75_04600 [Paludibacter sp.]|jgi:hypothetical protein|nr:hypothetical protein [Paludibacter sp.]